MALGAGSDQGQRGLLAIVREGRGTEPATGPRESLPTSRSYDRGVLAIARRGADGRDPGFQFSASFARSSFKRGIVSRAL